MIQPHIFQQVGFTIKLALTAITGENHYDAVSNKNKDAYVCVMHSTDVTKAGIDVVTVLSPKDKAPFECASTSPAQCCIQPSMTPLSQPSNENDIFTSAKEENIIPTPMKVIETAKTKTCLHAITVEHGHFHGKAWETISCAVETYGRLGPNFSSRNTVQI